METKATNLTGLLRGSYRKAHIQHLAQGLFSPLFSLNMSVPILTALRSGTNTEESTLKMVKCCAHRTCVTDHLGIPISDPHWATPDNVPNPHFQPQGKPYPSSPSLSQWVLSSNSDPPTPSCTAKCHLPVCLPVSKATTSLETHALPGASRAQGWELQHQ